MRVSVVIPVFEDRKELMRILPSVAGADEVIVVDSSREDPVLREDLPPETRLLRSGVALRSYQMNLGAAEAKGEAILFLHADTLLPVGACELLREVMEDAEVVGGGFEREFDSSSRVLRWTGRVGAWRSRRCGLFLGDQALFVRRAAFESAGGFRSLRAFEDYDLCRRLKKDGRLAALRPAVFSSARRFERDGALLRSIKDLGLTLVYFCGGARFFRSEQNGSGNPGEDGEA